MIGPTSSLTDVAFAVCTALDRQGFHASVRQSCNTSLTKGRFAVTVRDDGVVLLNDPKTSTVLELEPAGDVEPKFSERFKALGMK